MTAVSQALRAAIEALAEEWTKARHWGEYRQALNKIGKAVAASGFLGLYDVCLLLEERVTALGRECELPSDAQAELLATWPHLAHEYLLAPDINDSAELLVTYLRDSRWPALLEQAEEDVLLSLLVAETGQEPTGLEAEGGETFALAEPCEPPEARPLDGETDMPPPELSSGLRELVELLATELTLMHERIAELTPNLLVSDSPSETRADALDSLCDEVGRFAEAAEAVGFTGLRHIAENFRLNLRAYTDREACLTEADVDSFKTWCTLATEYLESFSQRESCAALVDFARSTLWPKPLLEPDSSELVALLIAPTLGDVEEQTEARPTVASAGDVSLRLPDDVDPALLDGLLLELPVQTADFSEAVQKLSTGEGTLGDVEAAQRAAHTLKGAANTVGVRGIATLTHHLEDILLASTKESVIPSKALCNVLMLASDCLENMSEAVLGMSEPPEEAVGVLQQVLDWANRVDVEGLATEETESAPYTAAQTQPVPRQAQSDVDDDTDSKPLPAVPMVRVPAPLLDELLRLVGETMTLTSQVQERVDQTRTQTHHMHEQLEMLSELGQELEQLIDLRDMSTPRQRLGASDEFDPLELDQYNELHTCTRRLVEAATDAGVMGKALVGRLSGLEDMLADHGRLNRESQEAVLQTRMVSVRSVLPRLHRSVRQTCRVTGKTAELHVSGADAMVDSDVLSDLVDPLMHILRNAVDHGVEDPEERLAHDKPAAGRIDLSFQREGNTLVVRCRDDGRGLDLALLRRLAVEQGVIEADALLTDTELSRLILEPSFSTRTDVTQVSGRGIGMSAVYSQVTRLGGALDIASEMGEGCVIKMRLPVTLISTHALLVRGRRSIFAVSNRGLEQILHPGAGELEQVGDELVLSVGVEEYTAYPLEHLVGIPGERRRRKRRPRPMLLIRADTATCAVLVEEVIDSRDLVIKNLGKYVPKLRGVAGATILGDGSVAPVLDLPELLRAPAKMAEHEEAVESLVQSMETELPTALVVDDSLSARRSLAQFMEDSGFNVRTARDGLEAIEVLRAKRPDILLVDMEMPRMNGLELTSHVRSQADTRNVPIIMITSRSTQKHRKQAESAGVDAYMTKPFSEEQLLQRIENIQGNTARSATAV